MNSFSQNLLKCLKLQFFGEAGKCMLRNRISKELTSTKSAVADDIKVHDETSAAFTKILLPRLIHIPVPLLLLAAVIYLHDAFFQYNIRTFLVTLSYLGIFLQVIWTFVAF